MNIELAKKAERVAKQLKKAGEIPEWTPMELAIQPAYDLLITNPKRFEELAEEGT